MLDAPNACPTLDARKLAQEAVRRAARPPGADPRTVAWALGILAYPCAEEDAAELGKVASHTKFRFPWSDNDRVRARRVWRGLARSLLLREGAPADVRTVDALARELAAAHK